MDIVEVIALASPFTLELEDSTLVGKRQADPSQSVWTCLDVDAEPEKSEWSSE